MQVVDNGKPFTSAVGDIRAGIKCLTYYGGYCDKIEGKTLAMENGKMGYTRSVGKFLSGLGLCLLIDRLLIRGHYGPCSFQDHPVKENHKKQ